MKLAMMVLAQQTHLCQNVNFKKTIENMLFTRSMGLFIYIEQQHFKIICVFSILFFGGQIM